jgi:hypothetical protein
MARTWLEQVVGEGGDALGRIILGSGQGKPQGQRPSGVEAGVHLRQLAEAAHHQPRPDHQHQSQGKFEP